MKLAQFIQTNMKQLLEGWEEAALEIAPELKGESRRALRDHARSMLKFICQDLATSQTRDESVRKALGKDTAPASGEHALDRVQQGLSMFQMVQEFRALRVRVIKAWSDEQRGLTGNDIDELVRFNEAIDQLIANSVSRFSALKDQGTRLIETMLKASPDPAAIFTPDGMFLYINTAMADLVNAPPRDVIGRTPRELGLDFAAELHEEITTTVTTAESLRRQLHCRLPSGRELDFDCQLVPVFDDQNNVEAVVKTSLDITESKQAEYQVWKTANFDSLTSLPNRRLFMDRLEQTLLEAERKGTSFAVLFIDLDRFKQANDQLGHRAGDRLLAQVAERISSQVRGMDTVARLGGDEFTLILKETGREGATEAAKALLTHLERAFHVDSHEVNLSGSIGLTLFPDDGKDADQLVDNADQAMYAAKEHGGQQVQSYEPWMGQSESEDRRWNRELEDALRENQLEVYYQPIIDIRTGAISRAEALLRWNHPYKGLLTPTAFLSITEQSGLTDRITAYVLEQAVTCSLQWHDLSDQPFPININESPASFVTRRLVDQWQARLTQIGLDESWITMELTPASFNNIRASGFNPVKNLDLTGLRLHLAIDDFGVEPFSLLALQEFRMGSVKVDIDLIKDAGKGGDADRILEAIIAMAHALNVRVVGVGVETHEQLQFLSRAGCDYAQGYLFSRPLRQDDFEALLKRDSQAMLS
ncbi:PAS domain S-box-containing protein/diguanylate cyclase (GGDEF)-like protein [Halospina denitrificans]|uniref:PAS domain S-box-containing protein/diguanylate cyclase (GGDEF)-like protein n=1 Tax=Halospina denitrificans TaxID=332522 RepID=A0A4R7JTW7_9GAMM|nr:EAL domain-containing protein [Halospina denitrificans]TDT41782.1 PAS domain S-box-containing protein/diguanylate cyclase (GGDEF)-like protein [Halospina denitrificans]